MSVLDGKLCAAAIASLLVLCLGGCASAPEARPVAPRESAGDELDRLRTIRDRAFDDIEGRPTDESPAAHDSPSTHSPDARRAAPARPGTGRRPEWAPTGFSDLYPAYNYIVGVGSARRTEGRDDAAIAMADDRARSGVAKQIRVRLRSEFLNSAHLVTEASSGKVVVERDTTAVIDRLSSTVDLKLEGLAIADRWHDKKEDRYWALAVLDRAMTADLILDRMARQMQQVAQDYELGVGHRGRGSPFQAMRYLNAARRESLALLNYRSQLRVISPAHAGSARLVRNDELLKSVWKEAALAAEGLRLGLILFTEVDGKATPSPQAEARLSQMLRGLGLNTVKLPPLPEGAAFEQMKTASPDALRAWVGEQANCLVLGHVAAEKIGSEMLVTIRVHFYESKADLVVLDLTQGLLVASSGFDLSHKTRASNKSPARAARASLAKAAREFCKQLEAELIGALNLGKGLW